MSTSDKLVCLLGTFTNGASVSFLQKKEMGGETLIEEMCFSADAEEQTRVTDFYSGSALANVSFDVTIEEFFEKTSHIPLGLKGDGFHLNEYVKRCVSLFPTHTNDVKINDNAHEVVSAWLSMHEDIDTKFEIEDRICKKEKEIKLAQMRLDLLKAELESLLTWRLSLNKRRFFVSMRP